MARCSVCAKEAVIAVDKPLCQQHFIAGFEARVRTTLRRFGMLSKKDRVAVACSGGKDSTVLLFLLKKFGYDVTALAIDEGIAGYRDSTLEDLRRFCNEQDVKLAVHSYQRAFDSTLDAALTRLPSMVPCRICGVWRRYLLNRHARSYDKLATGHNLDDEAQSIAMNLMRGNVQVAARIGPVTGRARDAQFTPRIKPLYLCTEREVATYAQLMGFGIRFTQCPNAKESFRSRVRTVLNEFERAHKGSKRRLVESFLSELPRLQKEVEMAGIAHCRECGEPSSVQPCHACQYAAQVRV